MSAEQRLDRNLPRILGDLAVGPYPDYIDDVLATTAQRRQRPTWMFPERWIPMDIARQSVVAPPIPWRSFAVFVLIAIALVAGTVLVVGALPRIPEPFGLARNGSISFERDGDIYVANDIGGEAHSIIAGPEHDFLPVFSLQGSRLLFFRESESGQPMLMLASADGSAVRELAGPFPAFNSIDWSPDGSQIAIGWEQRGFPRITLVPTDGSESATLALDFPAMDPAWRPPDGQQLLFRGQPATGPRSSLFLIGADGTGLQQLDLAAGDGNGVSDFNGATWSPDGTRVAFVRDDRSPTGLHGRIHVADIGIAGTVTKDRALEFDPDSDAEAFARWSPDGTRLSFQIIKDQRVRVAVAPFDGTGTLALTGPDASQDSGMFYTWAPDGTTLLSTYFADKTLWRLDPAGGEARKVGVASDVATWQRRAK